VILTNSTTLLSRGTNTRDDSIEAGIEDQKEIERTLIKNYRGVLQVLGDLLPKSQGSYQN